MPVQMAIRPMIMPKSPTRLTMNALLAALRGALAARCQKPISRYEQMPTSSQNTKTIATLPAITSPNMLKQNSERYWKKRQKRPRRRSGWPSASGASVIDHVGQLAVHVADASRRGCTRPPA